MNGKSTGEADVEFRCHEDAVAAMSKDKNHMRRSFLTFLFGPSVFRLILLRHRLGTTSHFVSETSILFMLKAKYVSEKNFWQIFIFWGGVFCRASLYRAISKLYSQRSSWNEWVTFILIWNTKTITEIYFFFLKIKFVVVFDGVFLFFFLHLPVFLKLFQVVVAAVDTTVTLEGVEAPEAVGFEVHTDDVTLLFQSILMFPPPPPVLSPMGRIYPKVLFLSRKLIWSLSCGSQLFLSSDLQTESDLCDHRHSSY